MNRRGRGGVFRAKYIDRRGKLRKSSTWTIQYLVPGEKKSRREATGLTNKKEAEALLSDRLSKLSQGLPVGAVVEDTTFADLSQMIRDDYRINEHDSQDRLKRSLAHLERIFGASLASTITSDRVSAYARTRKDEGAANATINRELAALKRAFHLAAIAGRVARVPHVAMLKESNVRKGFLEPHEFEAIARRLPEDVRPLAETLYITAWRPGEVRSRQWKDLDFESGFLRMEPGETKNDEGKMFPLTPQLRKILERQRERTTALEQAQGRIIPWIFHRNGKRIRDFRGTWAIACKDAGVPGRLIYDMKRSAARNFVRAGVSVVASMKMAGWKTDAIFRRYAIVDETMLKEAAAKLGALQSQHARRKGRKG